MYDTLVKITGSCKTPMGCESFLPVEDENGINVESGRMNLGVVTPFATYNNESNGDKEKFWEILKERLHICKRCFSISC